MSAAAGVAEDIEHGFFDRLRSLPIPRAPCSPGGRSPTLAHWRGASSSRWPSASRSASGSTATSPPALAAFGLCVVFGFAFGWMFICIGLFAGNAQAAQGMSMLVFPLTFVSSAYVPVETMPGWLQPIAGNQPITVMTNAVRGLTVGAGSLPHATSYYVGLSLVWTAAIIAIFAPVVIYRYKTVNS